MKVEDKAKTSLALDKSSYNLSPCEYIKKLFESEDVVTQSCLTLRPHGLQSARLLCPGNSPGKNTRVGCYSLLQGIFLTQGSNPGLPHCKVDSLPSEPPGNKLKVVIKKSATGLRTCHDHEATSVKIQQQKNHFMLIWAKP